MNTIQQKENPAFAGSLGFDLEYSPKGEAAFVAGEILREFRNGGIGDLIRRFEATGETVEDHQDCFFHQY
jgi:hypothetical protein